jgi:hypothetical protein
MSLARDLADGVINGLTPQASNMQPFNRIINGAMTIDQRNAGAAIASGYAIDRFQTVLTGIPSLVISSQQSTNVPTGSGFTNSYFTTVTTPATSYSTGGRYGILHRIEGNNVSDFLFGSASAKVVTISFWVRASVTGQYSVTIYNSASNRAYPAIYTISAVDAWEKKVVTIQGDNTGVWLTDNGRGFQVEWALGNDASRLGTPDVWNSAFITGATGNVRISDTSGATFYITGVQLEAGSTASSFAHENVGDTLQKCQRYYQRIESSSGLSVSALYAQFNVPFPVEMRATPTGSISDANGVACARITDHYTADSTVTSGATISLSNASKNGARVQIGAFSGLVTGRFVGFLPGGSYSSFMRFDAEL